MAQTKFRFLDEVYCGLPSRKRALLVVRSQHIKAAQLLAPVLDELEEDLFVLQLKLGFRKTLERSL